MSSNAVKPELSSFTSTSEAIEVFTEKLERISGELEGATSRLGLLTQVQANLNTTIQSFQKTFHPTTAIVKEDDPNKGLSASARHPGRGRPPFPS